MKITSFNPLILTKDAAPVIRLFEELGFERRHKTDNIADKDITNVSMKGPNGFHVDIAEVPSVQQDKTLIRMNVGDFDEAYQFLLSRGFQHPSGRVVEMKSSKSAMIVSPSGFAFDLCQHIKDE